MIDGSYVLSTISHRTSKADPRYPARRFAEAVSREAGCPNGQGYPCGKTCANPAECAADCWLQLAEEATR